MMKIIIPALLVFYSLTATADDYIVTTKNDTLRGKVSIQTYGTIDHVQVVAPDKKKTVLTAIQVTAVSMDNETYSPVRTNYGFRMMKLVRPGFVSLYLGRRASGPSDTGFYYDTQYLVRRDGNSMEVPNLSFKKAMANFLSECEDMKAKIEKEELGRKDLDKIIIEFNACIEDQTHESMASRGSENKEARMTMLKELRTKIDASSLSGKKDALDILDDVAGKVGRNQTVPNYQVDGMKNILKESPDLAAEFEKIIPLLNKP